MQRIIGFGHLLAMLAMGLTTASAGAGGAGAAASSQMVSITTRRGFDDLVAAVERAVEKHGLLRIATASASRNAAQRGIKIPGNAVVLAFNNLYAVRLLAASVPAGIEAPMRLYVTENADGTAALSYMKASVVLAPYGGDALGALGRELDDLFAAIAQDATGG
jgi:uncharacterized protein (DUF302 family)